MTFVYPLFFAEGIQAAKKEAKKMNFQVMTLIGQVSDLQERQDQHR